MENKPKRIFLNLGVENEVDNFNDCSGVTWSEHQIYDRDIEYISKKEFYELISEYDSIVETNESIIRSFTSI